MGTSAKKLACYALVYYWMSITRLASASTYHQRRNSRATMDWAWQEYSSSAATTYSNHENPSCQDEENDEYGLEEEERIIAALAGGAEEPLESETTNSYYDDSYDQDHDDFEKEFIQSRQPYKKRQANRNKSKSTYNQLALKPTTMPSRETEGGGKTMVRGVTGNGNLSQARTPIKKRKGATTKDKINTSGSSLCIDALRNEEAVEMDVPASKSGNAIARSTSAADSAEFQTVPIRRSSPTTSLDKQKTNTHILKQPSSMGERGSLVANKSGTQQRTRKPSVLSRLEQGVRDRDNYHSFFSTSNLVEDSSVHVKSSPIKRSVSRKKQVTRPSCTNLIQESTAPQNMASNGAAASMKPSPDQVTQPLPSKPTTMTAESSTTPWARKYISSRPKDCLMPVPRDYMVDNFNLVRLAPVVEQLATARQKELESSISPNLEHPSKLQQPPLEATSSNQRHTNHPYRFYRQALDLILKEEEDHTNSTKNDDGSPVVQYAAEVLYCLIHARFVVSIRGLDTMRRRLIQYSSNRRNQQLFGRCPHLSCDGMPLLPCGLSDDYGSHHYNKFHSLGSIRDESAKAKRYCCHCGQTFHHWDSQVDGSAWGTSVAHLLLMVYGKEYLFPSHFAIPYRETTSSTHVDGNDNLAKRQQPFKQKEAQPRIFGFPVHPTVTGF